MAFKNLGEFIDVLRKNGELVDIDVEVDPSLEITEIYERVVKKEGSALLFKKVKGSSMPLIVNLFGSNKRMELAFETKDINDIAKRIDVFFDLKVPETIIEKLKMIPKLGQLGAVIPKMVNRAPCQDNVVYPDDGAMIEKLPVLKCWPKDGGKFITLPLVITKDPKDGKRNVGMYRMQVYDDKTTGMHWQIHKDGAEHFRQLANGSKKRMEVACVLGSDPITIFSAACPLPKGLDEFVLAGFLRKKPIELVKCKTINLEVPAEAEIILEGYVEEGEMRMEGPFGDHTGFYSRAKEFPVFHVTCMTHRNNPIYPTTIVGRPPMEDCYIGKAIERVFLPLIKKQLPEIIDMNFPWEGCFHNCVIVSIKKAYPDHAKKVINAVWGLGQLTFSKCVIVLDHDTNIQDLKEVAWRVFGNVDPKRDMIFGEGPVDELDHSSNRDFLGSKVGIDSTRKTEEEGMKRPWPEDMKMSEEIKKQVTDRWFDYGLDQKYLQ